MGDNPKYKIGESEVHGKGVIATSDIKKGENIGNALNLKYGVIIDITPELGKWINHSWYPNCELQKSVYTWNKMSWDLIANKNIVKGDEIMMDYRDTPWFIAKPSIWYK